MLKDQEQFYQFILAQTKPAHQEEVKALLVDALLISIRTISRKLICKLLKKNDSFIWSASVELVKEVFQSLVAT